MLVLHASRRDCTSAAKIAMVKVKELTRIIQDALKEDRVNRGYDLTDVLSCDALSERHSENAHEFMSAGIGTSEDDARHVQFHDGVGSVDVTDESKKNVVVSSFSGATMVINVWGRRGVMWTLFSGFAQKSCRFRQSIRLRTLG